MGVLGIDALQQSQRLLVAHHHHHHQRQQQQQGYGFRSSGCGDFNNNPSSSSLSTVEAAAALPVVVSLVAQGHGRGGGGGGCGTSSLIHSSQVVRLPSASASASAIATTSSPSSSLSSASRKGSFTPQVMTARTCSSNWKSYTYCCSSSSARDRHFCTTTAFNWLFLSASSFPSLASSSTPSRWGKSKLRAAAIIGNRPPFSCCSSSSSSSSDAPNLDELLLVVARRWRPSNTKKEKALLSVPAFSKRAPFQLLQQREEPENFVYEILKVSASPIFSWLKKNQRIGILEIIPHSSRLSRPDPHPQHWSSSCALERSLLRFASFSSSISLAGVAKSIYFRGGAHGYQRMWAIRATSDYYNGDSSSSSISGSSSSSSRAEGQAASLKGGGGALLAQQQQQQQERHLHQRASPDRETGLEFLATGCGWRVRDAERGELRELIRVADIQSDAFHERSPLFDDLFSRIFHAEVLSSLQYKARNFDPNRYACLLAEMDTPEDSADEECDRATIVGAVDMTVLDDRDVLRHLSGADEYLYISGMAVDPDYRRQGVATLLLEACVARAMKWSFNYLVLHAYEDDFRARSLYSRAGYRVISADPAWMTKFLGRRRRVVMAKKIDDDADNDDNKVSDLEFT